MFTGPQIADAFASLGVTHVVWLPDSTLGTWEASLAGSHIATMPLKVLDSLFNHPLTDKGLEQFLKDYAKVFQEAPAAR